MGLELGEEFDFEFQVLLKYFLKSLVFIMRSNSPLKIIFSLLLRKNYKLNFSKNYIIIS